jgi:hypothetical protein
MIHRRRSAFAVPSGFCVSRKIRAAGPAPAQPDVTTSVRPGTEMPLATAAR